MLFQLTRLFEGFVTDVTWEWPLVTVCPQVLLEVAWLLEAFVAHGAFVWPVLIVVPDVFVEKRLSWKHPLTDSAVKAFLFTFVLSWPGSYPLVGFMLQIIFTQS